MKKWLIEELICPECLSRGRSGDPESREILLSPEIRRETETDIVQGHLVCPECGRRYDIHDGIAVVVPEKTLPVTRETGGYGSFSMLSSYLWSHYSEFFNGPDATDAYRRWASGFTDRDGWALDIGCAVGRLTFEMTKTHDRAVGVDTSIQFVRAARDIAARKELKFDLIMEGQITEEKESRLDPGFRYGQAEFIVADAMALPFRSHRFATASSVNILEKVPDPSLHLSEAGRIMDRALACFLFSDPFSWDESVNRPDLWLGGRNEGPFKGFGADNIRRLIEEGEGGFGPGFSILETGRVLWKIRKTRNLWEHITSQFIIAQKGQA